MYLYGYRGLSNVYSRRHKVSAPLSIVLSFEFPSSLRASVGRRGYLRLRSDAQVSNLSQWESFREWITYLFLFLLYVPLGLGPSGSLVVRHMFSGFWVVLGGFLGSRGCSRKSRECSRAFVVQWELTVCPMRGHVS